MESPKVGLDNFFIGPDDEFLDKELNSKENKANTLAKEISRNSQLLKDLKEIKDFDNYIPSEDEDIIYTNQKPKILSKNPINSDFLEVIKRAHYQIGSLPCLKYDDVYQELIQLTVKNIATPTLAEINSQLERVQSSKDRITELDILITQCFLMKERILDILKDSLQKFSTETTADKRKGDAAHLLSNFEMDFAKLESLQKSCKYIMMNLVSLQESISRRITTIQLQIKLNDIGRSSFGDFNIDDKIKRSDRSYLEDVQEKNEDLGKILPESGTANEFEF